MKRTLFCLFIFLCLILTGCSLDAISSRDKRIEECILFYKNKWDYKPGICVSVYSPSMDLDYDYAIGYFSLNTKEEVTKETPHLLYSITKSFIAASIVNLVNQGKLSYTDRVSDFIDGLNYVYINSDATIAELLMHRSGIYDYTDNPKLFYNNPFANSEKWEPAKILDYIETPAADRDTDKDEYLFQYSSANYILLGMIIENVAGIGLNEYIHENFLSPLSLPLLLTPEDEIDFWEISHPHIYPNTPPLHLAGDGKTPIDVTTVINNVTMLSTKCSWAAGGMVGSAKDVARWGYDLLSENGRIDMSIRNSILDSVAEFDSSEREVEAYGYGIRKLYHNGKEYIGSYGRSIGDENLMFYNKDKDVCICILTNSNTKSDGNPNIDELMYAIFDKM